ncbi:MAG: hypothetical protein GVY10_09560 [Verrucomicrobia bacterium]|jgi:hypothetical protein|nr:hypothetical protein [Verrucomicrobiota bacterium]
MPFRLLPLLLPALLTVLPLSAASGEDPPDQAPPPPQDLPAPPPLPPELKNSKPEGPPPDLPDPSELKRQLEQLEELLSMSPQRLQRLRQTIAFIAKMPDEEREAMRIRIRQITETSPELTREINQLEGWLPPSLHSDLSQFWLAATPDQRQGVRDRLAALENEEKAAYLEKTVRSFIERRDRVFQKMQESLEKRHADPEDP